MTLLPKLLGGYSGSIVDAMGYPGFFLLTALLGIPVLLLIIITARRFQIDEHSQ
jgi:PAT family beta-lactamase induction signal transducer AmpG